MQAKGQRSPKRRDAVPENHDDGKAHQGDDGSELVYPVQIAEDEAELVDSASVVNAGSFGSQFGEAKLGDQLVNKNDEANGRDEAAQERAGEHAVEEAEASNAGQKHGCAGNTGNNTANLCMQDVIVFVATARVNTGANDGANEQRTGCLGPDHHLRTTAEQRVDHRVEDKGVQATDGRHVGKVASEGQGHGQVDAGNG